MGVWEAQRWAWMGRQGGRTGGGQYVRAFGAGRGSDRCTYLHAGLAVIRLSVHDEAPSWPMHPADCLHNRAHLQHVNY